MKRIFGILFVTTLVLAPAVGSADVCPEAPDHTERFGELLTEVQGATNEGAAQVLVNQMWDLWADAPNEQAQEILDRGLRKRASYDFLGAISDFDILISYCPTYAEGYNQRGFVSFIHQDYEAALRDLDQVIALSPQHIGALSGRALTLMALGRRAEAHAALIGAIALNPWLPERRFLGQLEHSDETDL